MNVLLTAMCLAASSPSDATVKAFVQFYDSLVQYRAQAQAAEKDEDWKKARAYYRQLADAADKGLQRIEQSKQAKVWKADLVFETKDGKLKADKLEAAVKALKTQCAERLKKVEAAAGDPKQRAAPSAAAQADALKRAGGYYDALLKIDGEATSALAAKDVLTAGQKLEQLVSAAKAFTAALSDLTSRGLEPSASVSLARGKATVKELSTLGAALQASAEKRLKAIGAEYQAAREKRAAELREQRKQQAAALAARLAKNPAPARTAGAEARAPAAAPARVDYYGSATFALGRCSFGRCATDGWTHGDVSTRCNVSKCLSEDWSSSDGSETRCNFGNCMKEGWVTTHPDGSASETRCNFSDCLKSGWSTVYPDGTASDTSCNFSECAVSGWSTQMPNGEQINCRCSFQDCLGSGAECD